MDTISRENNSMLPVGGIVVGVLGLLLGVFALVQATKANNAMKEQQAKIDKIEGIESQVTSITASTEKNARDVKSLFSTTQDAISNQIAPRLGNLETAVTKLEAATARPVPMSGKKNGEPAVAGPNEYIVKAGDTGVKIASANQVSVGDLQTVNPGIEWTKIRPGQRIKLPLKK